MIRKVRAYFGTAHAKPRTLFSFSFVSTVLIALTLHGASERIDAHRAERLAYGPPLPVSMRGSMKWIEEVKGPAPIRGDEVWAKMERPDPRLLLTPVAPAGHRSALR